MSLFEDILPARRDWSRIGDSYEVTKKPRDLDIASLDAIPFAPMDSIPQGGAYHPDYTLKSAAEIKSGTYFERGDILVAKITPSFENGKQALATNLPTSFGYATTEVIPLRSRNVGNDPRLLFYFLLHPDVRNHVSERMEGATGRKRIPLDVLLDVQYPCFSLQNQTKIANVLETIQQMINIETRSVNTIHKIKNVAMNALYTHGIRGDPQRETEVGPMPQSWESVPLGECAFVQSGVAKGRKTGDAETIRLPYLRVANVQDGHLDLTEVKKISVRTAEIERYKLRHGDVVLTEGGDIDKLGRGFIWRSEIPICVHQNHIYAIRTRRDRLLPEFLAYQTQSPYGKDYFLKVAHKTTNLACINTTKLKAFPVLLPTPEEQREIVAILEAVDRKIDLHRRKREMLDELFKTVLHKIVTGAIRIAGDRLEMSQLRTSGIVTAELDDVSRDTDR